MENKRKASGVNGLESVAETADDRAAKRRKLQEEYGDLSNGESTQSTTAYGLSILDSIRATTDKNGRSVSPAFEALPSRSEDPEYYKKIRLPLSLQLIERKLKNGDYSGLSSLEGDFKRLVSNYKETHDKSSVIYNDAERVRKAVSNLMVKYNPAYKSGNYQATATPLPPSPGPDDFVGEEDADGEEEEPMENVEEDIAAGDQGDAEVEVTKGKGEEVVEEEEEENNVEDEEADEEAEEDDDEQEDEDDEDAEPARGSTPRRRGGRRSRGGRRGGRGGGRGGRKARDSLAISDKGTPRGPTSGKANTHYENVPYEGLTFQQAQEKVVEDMIRKKDESGEYPQFEPFITLPSRILFKDYFEVIAEPMSLNMFQKQVRGQHGRSAATWISDFKTWAAFEDQASLIWKNAYHYNEDGSEIFVMAQELEQYFYELVKEAKQHVPEPPQPKIKLKVPQNSETPSIPKKKFIVVGGKTASAAGSPAAVAGQSGEGEILRNGTPMGRNPFAASTATSINLSQLEKARSLSVSAGPPSPSPAGPPKVEEPVRQPPAILPPQHGGLTNSQFAPPPPMPHAGVVANGIAPQLPPPPPKLSAADILEAQKYRAHPIKEGEALLPTLIINSHPTLQLENRLSISIPASPTEAQQELVFNAPASHYRLQLRPRVALYLETQQREWKLNVLHDSMRIYPTPGLLERRSEPVFDVNMHYGTNRLEVSLVAALPKGEVAPNGLNMELERFVVYFNLVKH
ncbi:Bromodomain-containing protein [Xylariomycetidae sp. FL2044]|nr:Bromodomain-containing protein [Xylariomycetidae sp. FL2044]